MDNQTLLLVLLGVVALLFVFSSCKLTCGSGSEGFGQDASIRASAGSVAGQGMYGYDPIAKFAREIKQMTAYERAKHPQEDFIVEYAPAEDALPLAM